MSHLRTDSHRSIRRPFHTAVAGLCLIAAAPTFGAQVNRVLDDIAAVPAQQPGTYDIHVQWHAEAAGLDQSENLSTSVVILVNGAEVGTLAESLGVKPGGAPCAGLPCNTGVPCGFTQTDTVEPMSCAFDPQQGCKCVSAPFCFTLPGIELTPGDQISAQLEPLGEALPDPPQDNQKTVQMGEGARGWNRALLDAQVIENEQDEQVLQLEIAFTSAVEDINVLDFGVGIQVGGTTIGLAGEFTVEVFPLDGCSFDCEPDGCPTPQSDPGYGGYWETFCSNSGFGSFPWYQHCRCMNIYILVIEFDQVEFIEPGYGFTDWEDIIDHGNLTPPTVVLLPSSGAPAELITADDTIVMKTGEPQPPASCPEDTNGDGVVNSIDLNAILAKFGLTCG